MLNLLQSLVDSDDDQTAAHEKVCAAIAGANGHADVDGCYPIPMTPFLKESADKLSVAVVLQPGRGERGCLETLLWKVMARLYPKEASCVDGLLTCTGINDGPSRWSNVKLDKARGRSLVAVMNRRNPACALSLLWDRFPDIIPVSEKEFDDLADHIAAI